MSNENMRNDAMNTEEKDSGPGESFAELFEKKGQLPERLAPGQKVRARVVSISQDLVFIDLGGKSEGGLDLSEFKDQEGNVEVHEGDEIEAVFVSVQNGLMKLTTLINGYSITSLDALSAAHESGVPIEGTIESSVKGGFKVSIGGVRCFCPSSQVDLRGGRESGSYIRKSFPFKILEYKESGKNVVVSRRVLLEEERRGNIERLKETLAVGAEVSVPVVSIRNFGVFVDLGGFEGMIPISELSWSRVDHPQDVVSVGQEVTAKIIALDWDRERITLSMKALQPDPWTGVEDKFSVGSKINGMIVRLAPFGAFVALEPGIDGLMHISNLGTGRRIKHPKEVVKVGQPVEAYVISVDPGNRKISLSMKPLPEPKKIVYPNVGDLIEGTVDRVMPFGVFLKISDDLSGLIPNSEMDTPKGADHSGLFPKGTAMKAVVVDVDTANGKVRLSRKEIEEKETQKDFQQYREAIKKEETSSDGLSSFGRLLKAKMDEKKAKEE